MRSNGLYRSDSGRSSDRLFAGQRAGLLPTLAGSTPGVDLLPPVRRQRFGCDFLRHRILLRWMTGESVGQTRRENRCRFKSAYDTTALFRRKQQ